MTFIHDTLVVFRRELRLSLRNPAWVVIVLVQPVLYLVLFGPLLTQAARRDAGRVGRPGSPAGTAEAYRFFVPGLLIQLGLFGSMFVGFAIISDWRGGVIERFRVTPVSRLAVMSGRVLRDTLVLVVQAVDPGARRHRVRAARAGQRGASSASASSSWWPSAWPRCRTRPP